MTFEPLPGDLLPRGGVIKLSPQVFVLHRLPVNRAPVVGSPAREPFGDALAQYSESVKIVISQDSLSAVRAEMAAWSSIRLLVVAGSPRRSHAREPITKQCAHPPGPGLPSHPPSVWIVIFLGLPLSDMRTQFQSRAQSVEDFCLPARSQQPEQLAPIPSPDRLSSPHAVAHLFAGLTGMIPRPQNTPLRLGLLGLLMAAIAAIRAEPSNTSAPAPSSPVSSEAPRAMARRPMPKAEWLDPDRGAPNGTQYKTFESKVLGREVSYLVYLPPGYEKGSKGIQ